MRLVLKAPGTTRLKAKRDELLSNSAFNFNLRYCIKAVHSAVCSAKVRLLDAFGRAWYDEMPQTLWTSFETF